MGLIRNVYRSGGMNSFCIIISNIRSPALFPSVRFQPIAYASIANINRAEVKLSPIGAYCSGIISEEGVLERISVSNGSRY